MLVLAQCSSDSGAQSASPNISPTTLLVTYGDQPTKSAQMICNTDGQEAIDTAFNLVPPKVTAPTWVDHLYSCTYQYDSGSFDLSVKELPSIPETVDYFNSLKAKSTATQPIGLGQEGFETSDDMSVVRKDNKVLVVDVSKLGSQFGTPPLTRSDASLTIATALLGCWTGD
jgi:hypothetical protein